jgi:hypothetical protein
MANANELVRKLVEIGVLKEISGRKRDRKFAYSAYLDLFADDAGEAKL